MGMPATKPIDLDEYLNHVNYAFLQDDYVPSEFALHFIDFIKLVNGSEGEENKSPLIHFDMLDQIASGNRQNLFVSFRGSAKTTALHEYMILYIAVYKEIPGFGNIDVGMYISDTIDNGVKSMRKNLEFRWSNSDFLQKYLPKEWIHPTKKDSAGNPVKYTTSFTDVRWEFVNADGKRTCYRGFGASTGVRGFKEYGQRPTWCGFDDLMSDKNAESPTITKDIKHIIYKAARQALHPQKRMQVWTGTPFNKSDPLYEAASSAAWNTRAYPICEKFPCKKEEFKGAWEDRFSYDFVKGEYDSLLASGEIAAFNQELMLRITSDEDRLIDDTDLVWYSRDKVIQNRMNYNFYVTTDLTTSEEDSADYAVIGVWAYSNNGDWLLVDGVCRRQQMDKSLKQLFQYVSVYRPLSVGIEINGQQQGFINWIKEKQIDQNIFFNLAGKSSASGKSQTEGIRRSRDKLSNFKLFAPTIKAKKMWLPRELRNHELVVEMLEELRFATNDKLKSKHDDVIDMTSMLLEMDPVKPSMQTETEYIASEDGQYAHIIGADDDDDMYRNSTVF